MMPLLSSLFSTRLSLRGRALTGLLLALALPNLAGAQLQFRVPLQGLVVTTPAGELPGGGEDGDEEGGEDSPAPGQTQGIFGPTERYSVDFGLVGLGYTATQQYRFRNTGPVTAHVHTVLSVTSGGGMQLVSDGCGSPGDPVAVAPGSSCRVEVAYSPSSTDSTAALLRLEGNLSPELAPLALSGRGSDASMRGAWSTQPNSTTAPETLSFPLQTAWTNSDDQILYLRNEGTHGQLSARFALEGDTDHFRILSVYVGGSNCNGTPSILTGNCTAKDPAVGPANQTYIKLHVSYRPTAVGEHTVYLRALPGINDSILPTEAVVLTGQAAFNATGAWSTTGPGLVSPGPVVDFGPTTNDIHVDSAPKTSVYLVNTGTHGQVRAQFALEGDTEHFRLDSAYGGSNNCKGTNPILSSVCTGKDPAATGVTYAHLTFKYMPKAVGVHTLHVRAIPAGTDPQILPAEPLVLRGESVFNPAGVWSMERNSVVAPAPITFAPRAVNTTSSDERFWLLNLGTHGSLSAVFTLEGDTEHFRISSATNGSSTCQGLPVITTNVCKSGDPALGKPSYLSVYVSYRPKAAGTHSVQLRVLPGSTDSVLPDDTVTLTGSAY